MSDESLTAIVEEHFALFNRCVDSGDWAPFLETYAEDAVLEIEAGATKSLQGIDAIATFYTARPPKEHMSPRAIEVTGPGTTTISFSWDSGRKGRLTVSWDGSTVSRAVLAP